MKRKAVQGSSSDSEVVVTIGLLDSSQSVQVMFSVRAEEAYLLFRVDGDGKWLRNMD